LNFNPELCRNETEVESKLIVQYLLPALGYLPDSWYQEVAFGNIRLDFLAFASQVLPFTLDDSSPLSLIVEAKGPQENLNKHERKIKSYLAKLRVPFGVLTNGRQFRIYHQAGNACELVFECAGRDIFIRISDIKSKIGRHEIKEAVAPVLQPESDIQPALSKEKQNVKTIAVYHNKGGVGKTTVSVNLAAALSRKGFRVLLVDIDSQANSTFATGLVKFEFDEDDTLKDSNVSHLLLSGDLDFIPDLARKSQLFNEPEIDVIPSHITLIDVQEKLNQIAVSRTRLPMKLKLVEDQYDFVIIDTPPSKDLYAQLPMIASDYLIIPSDLKPFANQGLPSVKNFVKDTNEYRNSIGRGNLQILGVLPSKINTNAKFLQSTFPKQKEVVSKKYDLPVFETIIFERVALSHCTNEMVTVGDLQIPNPQSIFQFEPHSSSAQEFEDLAVEVLNKIGQ
jgi:chromosome partitioning protein